MERCKLHRLAGILVIAPCAVNSGADTWSEDGPFGRAKFDWLRTFLALPHGIPSHDTFGRVFTRLSPDPLERCFPAWMQSLARVSGGRLFAFYGKRFRRSFDKADGKAAVHMVSAWCQVDHFALEPPATDRESVAWR